MAIGLTEEQLSELTPLAVMLLVMTARVRASDHAGALEAAAAAAPYMHPRLSSADLRVRNEYAGKSDAEIAAELAALEARFSAAEVVH